MIISSMKLRGSAEVAKPLRSKALLLHQILQVQAESSRTNSQAPFAQLHMIRTAPQPKIETSRTLVRSPHMTPSRSQPTLSKPSSN